MIRARFYLGTHMAVWLERTATPLFVSRRRLADRHSLPRARGRWVLDSGGYSELHLYGEWRLTVGQYFAEVVRFADQVGGLDWCAPMDWMCEPSVRERTGLDVAEHQARTIDNYLRLRDVLGVLVAPVLQGWEPDDYARHVDAYDRVGVDLSGAAIVGVGSICRRNADAAISRVVRELDRPNLHAFGVRGTALRSLGDVLASADSMAWSARGRRDRLPGCSHRSCGNCLRYAERWHRRTLETLDQLRIGDPLCATD